MGIAWILTKFEVITLKKMVKIVLREMNALYNNWVIFHSIPNVGYQMEQWDTRL